jgi:DNA-binding transcriptional MerR regulator
MLKCTSSQGDSYAEPVRSHRNRRLGSPHRPGQLGAPLLRAGWLAVIGRAGGRRQYVASSAERVALIQLCQDAGFTLREIGALLAAWSRRGRRWARLAETKLRELDSRIAQAEHAKTLVQHVLACPHRNLVTCPNFRAALKAYLGSRDRTGHAAHAQVVTRRRRHDR